MLLDLRSVRGSDALVERSYPPSYFSGGDRFDYSLAAPVDLAIRVSKDGDKYRLRGRILAQVRRDCCRCLQPFDVSMDLEVDLRYHPQRIVTEENDYEIAEGDLVTAFYSDDQIDLGGLIREQLNLASPMKPLCNESCRGLCPVCGMDWNRRECQCDASWQDPRLDALKSLFPQNQDAGRTRKD